MPDEIRIVLVDDHPLFREGVAMTLAIEPDLEIVGQGVSNKEIGRDLDLQEKTVKHYMTNTLQKLQVRNRVEAALLARDRFHGG